MEKVMTKVIGCNEVDCAYNRHNSCHTMAITVGGPEACPQCDTYIAGLQTGGIADMKAGVGACKVSNCSFNDSLECTAAAIKVGRHMDHPDCMSFKSR